jgi:hypothetical protein
MTIEGMIETEEMIEEEMTIEEKIEEDSIEID